MIYLASPYSHPDPAVRQLRYEQAMACKVQLLLRRVFVYSPIVACHHVAVEYDLPLDANWWADYNYDLLNLCTSVAVLRLDGWEQSLGIAQEVKWADAKGMPIRFIDFFDGVVPSNVNGEMQWN